MVSLRLFHFGVKNITVNSIADRELSRHHSTIECEDNHNFSSCSGSSSRGDGAGQDRQASGEHLGGSSGYVEDGEDSSSGEGRGRLDYYLCDVGSTNGTYVQVRFFKTLSFSHSCNNNYTHALFTAYRQAGRGVCLFVCLLGEWGVRWLMGIETSYLSAYLISHLPEAMLSSDPRPSTHPVLARDMIFFYSVLVFLFFFWGSWWGRTRAAGAWN